MFSQLMSMVLTEDFLFSIIRITAPILFAALGAVVAEKAGVTNIGLEGTMMISALFGTLVSYWTQSWVVGVLAAVAVGVLLGLMMGFFYLKLKTDIILAGIAVNMLGGGGTIFLLYMFTGMRGNTGALSSADILIPTINIPLIDRIPVLRSLLSGHSVLTYVAFLSVLLVWVLLYRTSLGLNIRAVGENANAASSVGVSVNKIRFIALAAQAMGRGEPVGAMLSSLLFGLAQALKNKVTGLTGLASYNYLVASIPYIVTIVGLVIYAASTIRRAKRHRKASEEK